MSPREFDQVTASWVAGLVYSRPESQGQDRPWATPEDTCHMVKTLVRGSCVVPPVRCLLASASKLVSFW